MQPIKYSLSEKRFELSKANVENVVNPPHSPVFKKRTSLMSMFLYFAAAWLMIPITKEPKTLINIVIKGNFNFLNMGISPKRCRNIAPINPPAPTHKYSKNIIV